jgi:hypothetical protein
MIIAIDPGKSGGIAVSRYMGKQIQVFPMPATEKDLVELLASFMTMDPHDPCKMIIEKVGGYVGGRGQPGSAMFEFGKWAWGPVWVAQCYQIPVQMVTPQKWQKVLSLGTSTGDKTKWKNKLKSEAQRRYPQINVTLKTADALLILAAEPLL